LGGESLEVVKGPVRVGLNVKDDGCYCHGLFISVYCCSVDQ
jgi:hypothetical protein